MKTFELSGKKREIVTRAADQKRALKALRKQNEVPAVMYGGKEVIHMSVPFNEVRKLIYTPEIYLVDLNIDGTVHTAILKETQFGPVTDELLHIDFYEVATDKPIVMNVPIVLQGHADGVKAGGQLNVTMRRLKVKGLYGNIPEELVVNVDKLALGKSIQVGSLQFDGIELVSPKNAVVCSVSVTRAALSSTTEEAAPAGEEAPAADAAAPAADAETK